MCGHYTNNTDTETQKNNNRRQRRRKKTRRKSVQHIEGALRAAHTHATAVETDDDAAAAFTRADDDYANRPEVFV